MNALPYIARIELAVPGLGPVVCYRVPAPFILQKDLEVSASRVGVLARYYLDDCGWTWIGLEWAGSISVGMTIALAVAQHRSLVYGSHQTGERRLMTPDEERAHMVWSDKFGGDVTALDGSHVSIGPPSPLAL